MEGESGKAEGDTWLAALCFPPFAFRLLLSPGSSECGGG
jgi:hypothetical protein